MLWWRRHIWTSIWPLTCNHISLVAPVGNLLTRDKLTLDIVALHRAAQLKAACLEALWLDVILSHAELASHHVALLRVNTRVCLASTGLWPTQLLSHCFTPLMPVLLSMIYLTLMKFLDSDLIGIRAWLERSNLRGVVHWDLAGLYVRTLAKIYLRWQRRGLGRTLSRFVSLGLTHSQLAAVWALTGSLT